MSNTHTGRGASTPRHLLVPHGLDLWEVLPTKLRRQHHVDSAKLILHRVITGSMRSTRDRYTGMSHKEASVLAGDHRTWDRMSDALTGKGVLENDGNTWKGEKEYGKTYDWRLTERWESAPLDRYVPKDPAILGRLAEAAAKAWSKPKGKEKPRIPAHDHYQSWVERLELDDAGAARALDRIEPEKRATAAKAAEAIGSGDPAVRVAWACDHGRFHHILTLTFREIRQECTIGDEHLADVDVTNAQPLICGINAAEWWATTHKPPADASGARAAGREEEAGGRERQGRGPNTKSPSKSAPILRLSDTETVYPGDLIHYLSVCLGGRFYEELADVLGLREPAPGKRFRGEEAKSRRDQAKGQSNFLIMGDPLPNSPPWLRFSGRWPTVAGYLRWVKRDDFKRSSHALQRKESDIMISGVGTAMLRDHPDVPVVPIHDGILTPPWAVDLVADVIRGAWRDRAGVEVPLKVKPARSA